MAPDWGKFQSRTGLVNRCVANLRGQTQSVLLYFYAFAHSPESRAFKRNRGCANKRPHCSNRSALARTSKKQAPFVSPAADRDRRGWWGCRGGGVAARILKWRLFSVSQPLHVLKQPTRRILSYFRETFQGCCSLPTSDTRFNAISARLGSAACAPSAFCCLDWNYLYNA